MAALRVLLGTVAGVLIAFGSLYLVLHFAFNAGSSTALVVAGIGGLIGGVYSAVAFARGIYGLGPFSVLGYLLDMSWSLPNTAASLLVWLPACMIAGEISRRQKPSLGYLGLSEKPSWRRVRCHDGWDCNRGGWSSHEEIHVWQGRMFGLSYLPIYGLSLLLNLLFRLCTGRMEELTLQAYYRICFEDWAYSAGSTSGENIHWGGWILWFFLSLIYAGSVVLIFVGAFARLRALKHHRGGRVGRV